MNAEMPDLSDAFKRLYWDEALFDGYSAFHPVNFRRVLPFQEGEQILDDSELLGAEESQLAERSDATRLAVVDEYWRCGLLPEAEAGDLRGVVDFYGTDFFNVMGLAYANAGMHRCALRWYREVISELESRNPESCADREEVYASVGYSLYSLGLFEEAIIWSKACIGPVVTVDAICEALIGYEARLAGGAIRAVERTATRTRYTVSVDAPGDPGTTIARLKAEIATSVPFGEVYLDWVVNEARGPEPERVYPFKAELDGGSLQRHKMNLICATCSRADALMERGYRQEAKRLLSEAAMIEPGAWLIRERLQALP